MNAVQLLHFYELVLASLCPDFFYEFVSKERVAVIGSESVAALRNFVGVIFKVRAGEKVRRIAARWVVAAVENLKIGNKNACC